MLERYELHVQAIALARMLHRPHTVIRFANNGSLEPAYTYWYEVTR